MNKQRYELAAKLRSEKKTFRKIGEALGVGPQRARQIVMKAEQMQNAAPRWTDGLRPRTGNSLRVAGFKSREEVELLLANKGLSVGDVYEIGQKAIDEIRHWLGLEAFQKSKSGTEAAITRAIMLLERNGYRVEKMSNVN